MEPPGCLLHRRDGQDFVSHQVDIGQDVGAFPFFAADGKLTERPGDIDLLACGPMPIA